MAKGNNEVLYGVIGLAVIVIVFIPLYFFIEKKTTVNQQKFKSSIEALSDKIEAERRLMTPIEQRDFISEDFILTEFSLDSTRRCVVIRTQLGTYVGMDCN